MTDLIAAATTALSETLAQALGDGIAVETQNPAFRIADAAGGPTLNLFLYAVRQISAARNAARDPAGGGPQAPVVVTLGLSYLVTAYDPPGDGARGRAAIETATRLPLTHPVLPPRDGVDSLKLIWLPFEESVARVWPLLRQPYRLSLAWDLIASGNIGTTTAAAPPLSTRRPPLVPR